MQSVNFEPYIFRLKLEDQNFTPLKKPSAKIRLTQLPQSNVIVLMVVVISSASFLILVNYFTIKTLSAVRAYTNGESRYSKGQKDAARYLTMYINTEDEVYWAQFQKELKVPIGDSIARVTLTNEGDLEKAKQGFLDGRNHKDDLDDLIWLFQNFKDISFMKNAIRIWKAADAMIGEELDFAMYVREQILEGLLSEEEKNIAIKKINEITSELTRRERAFSDILGSAARKINTYLFIINIFMTFLIIGGSSAYASVMIKRLRDNNRDLLYTNQELNKFVYSASHDLRSPLTSMKGLITLAKDETDLKSIHHFLSLMNKTLDNQDRFIHDIIEFSKNKRDDILLEEISLLDLVNHAIEVNNNSYQATKLVTVNKDIQVNTIIGDALRYKIIFNNIISNAIKYSDLKKDICHLWIRTYSDEKSIIIEIVDNGIGIRNEDLNRIFDMFYVLADNKGSGLGLYVTKQTVEKLNGTIEVESELGRGTKFTVTIPLYYATIL